MDEKPCKPSGPIRERLAAANLLMLFEAAASRNDFGAMWELLGKAGLSPEEQTGEREAWRRIGEAAIEATIARSRNQ